MTQFSVLGKLPCQPDYVHWGHRSTSVEEVFDWLVRSSETFEQHPDAGAMNAFCYGVRDSFVLGNLAPSRDSAGRVFPAAVAIEYSSPAQRASTLPIVAENCWIVTGEILAKLLATGMTQADVATCSPPILGSGNEAWATYHDWIEQMTVRDWVELVFESSAETAALAVAAFSEAVSPLSQPNMSATRLTLSLPLGRVGGAAACFWLDALSRYQSSRVDAPTFFWSHDGMTGRMLLAIESPSLSVPLAMWNSPVKQKDIFDIVAPELWGNWRPDDMAIWQKRMCDHSAPLSSLLDALNPIHSPENSRLSSSWWQRERS